MSSIKEKLLRLPNKPGVYQMQDEHGKVLYVGKARDLKKRVAQYFRGRITDAKTSVLMQRVRDFSVIITTTENEALLLESNLIKELHPRYNVLLRDDKSYPYLFLSFEHTYPRLDFYRGKKK